MKAICVTSGGGLELRDIPLPIDPPPGHVLVDIEASAINHGDKAFLAGPLAAANAVATSRHDVWGSSAVGVVVATGADVPADLVGRSVAVYRSLVRSPDTIGLWCERAQVPYRCCVVLPPDIRARDYCGSLVNIVTAYTFLAEIRAAGHQGIVVTAGRSATARALAALARRWDIPAIFVTRRPEAESSSPAERVLMSSASDFEAELAVAAEELGTTAVFDGVGGDLISRIAPVLPMNATIYVYGFLGGPVPVSFPTSLIMAKNLTLRRFRNYETTLVKDPQQLANALDDLAGIIADPLFATTIGREFRLDEIDRAMAFETDNGAKAVLVA